MIILPLLPDRWNEVKRIYEEGIATGHATFQSGAPSWEEWDAAHVKACRLLAMEGGEVLGWAALTPVSDRCVYAGVAEVSIYVGEGSRDRGVGKQLLGALILESEKNGFWTLQAGIFPENPGSLHIHQSHGFRIIGTRERLGKMNGVWRDVLLLERRSNETGQE